MKCVILSLGTGGGHDAAAQAVQASLKKLGVEAEMYDSYGVISSFRSKMVCETYLGMVKHVPKLFGWVYRLAFHITSSKRKSVVYAFNTRKAGRLADFLKSRNADAILFTHIFAGQQLTYLRRHGKLDQWIGGVITDYDLQPFWNEAEIDMIFSPHESLNAAYEGVGIRREHLLSTGIPVDPEISASFDRREAKREAGVDPSRPHVLVAGGSMGAGKLPGTIRALLDGLDQNVQITVVCGSNHKLMREFNRMHVPETRLRVLGFVRPLHRLMRSADVFISKPGGLSSTEAFVQNIPMIAAHPIQGVESNNAEFMQKNGLAFCPETDEEIVRDVKRLLNDPSARENMLRAQRENVPEGAAMRIAEHVVRELSGRSGG